MDWNHNSADLIVCPGCHQPLQNDDCAACGVQFKRTLDILDLRWPPAGATPPSEIAERMLAAYPSADVKQLIMIRFELDQPDKATKHAQDRLKQSFVSYHQSLAERGNDMLNMFDHQLRHHLQADFGSGIAVNLGCGTGAGFAELATRFEHVIGIDPSLESLIIAKKLLEEAGTDNVTLVLAYGQHMPVRSAVCDYMIAQNVLEHLLDLQPAFAEIKRVLSPGGYFCGDSRNRFDLFFPEPHTDLRWVGFMPVNLQAAYVRLLKRRSYEGTRLLSVFELAANARRTFKRTKITLSLPSAYGQSDRWDDLIGRIEQNRLLRGPALLFYPSHILMGQI